MTESTATRNAVRLAVRSLIEDTPELRSRPALRRHLAERMVDVSLTAAELLAEDHRLSGQISERVRRRSDEERVAADGVPLAAGQAAGDIHRRTAVNAAAGVLRSTRDAIDFPGFVTSLITGVFQAMTTSTIQQLQAVADLLDAVNAGASEFGTRHVTADRAVEWATSRFPALQVDRRGERPRLIVGSDAEMPEAAQLKAALEATDNEVGSIEDDNLEETLLPLVRRKLARDRQKMLRTMVLMGLQRIVVDEGRIHASMHLQVDARSTAEQLEASRFDTRVTTSGSGSFGMGIWGASASLSATVGYVKSDEQFTREDIALRAGLRSRVDVAFHTEPIALNRMASRRTIQSIQSNSMQPETEQSLLATEERKTTRATFEAIPQLPTAPDPGSEEQRALRSRRDFGSTSPGGETTPPPETATAPPPEPNAPAPAGGGGGTDAVA